MIDINKIELTEREQNIARVLNEMFLHETLSPAEIGINTTLSPATISRVLIELQEKSLVQLERIVKTAKGRRPKLFSFNNDYAYLIHFNITDFAIHGYLTDFAGNIIEECSRNYDENDQLEQLLDAVSSIHDQLKKNCAASNKRIVASGFSVPGVVNDTMTAIYKIPNVRSIEDTNFFDYAKKIVNVPIIINNQSRNSVVGEKILNYRYVENLAYLDITSQTGLGLGLIVNNQLVTGNRNYAGEIGQAFFDYSKSIDEYVQGEGFLENEAGLSPLVSRVEQVLKKGGGKKLQNIMKDRKEKKPALASIEEAAKAEDEEIAPLFHHTLKLWAITIININLFFNPDFIVLGGAITNKSTYIFNELNHMLGKLGYFKPNIRLSLLGQKAQFYGGIHALKQYAHNNILLSEVRNIK
jgi:predicted NBD/HSP70 family sugar kinase